MIQLGVDKKLTLTVLLLCRKGEGGVRGKEITKQNLENFEYIELIFPQDLDVSRSLDAILSSMCEEETIMRSTLAQVLQVIRIFSSEGYHPYDQTL